MISSKICLVSKIIYKVSNLSNVLIRSPDSNIVKVIWTLDCLLFSIYKLASAQLLFNLMNNGVYTF